MAPRTAPGKKRPTARRVEDLEKQVASLATRVAKAERAAAKATPRPIASRPGRAAGLRLRGGQATRRDDHDTASEGVRCPGCTLRVHEPRERCGYCGFLFSVLPASRRPDHVLRKDATGKVSKARKKSLSLTRRPGDR